MLQKYKGKAYATLLLITVLVLPYAGNVTAEAAEKYGCSWDSKKILANCLKDVISERDATIEELQAALDQAKAENPVSRAI